MQKPASVMCAYRRQAARNLSSFSADSSLDANCRQLLRTKAKIKKTKPADTVAAMTVKALFGLLCRSGGNAGSTT